MRDLKVVTVEYDDFLKKFNLSEEERTILDSIVSEVSLTLIRQTDNFTCCETHHTMFRKVMPIALAALTSTFKEPL